ncbi:MAG: head-tail connector protein [Pseudomonadota bacterium]
MQALSIIVPPAVEPVSIGEVKTFLRLDDEAEMARLGALIRAAREACELFVGSALITRTVRLRQTLMAERFYLRSGPVQGITALSAFQGADETILNAADYALCETAGRWHINICDVAIGQLIQVDYVIGLGGDWNAVPEAIRQGLLRLIAHQYEHRSDPSVAALPHAVTALWQPYRALRI